MGYIALDKIKHQNFGFKSDSALSFASEWSFLPLSSVELHQHISHLPICFYKNGSNIQIGLPTGIYKDINVLIHPQNFKSLIANTPAVVKRYPFNVSKLNEDGDVVFLVLEDETSFEHVEDENILDSNGELAQRGKEYLAFMIELNKQFEIDSRAIELIDKFKLLTPMSIKVNNPDKDELLTTRDDLYRIDSEKLKNLSKDELYELHAVNGLEIIHASITSMKNINGLLKMAQYHETLKDKKEEKLDLDEYFKENNDTLNFDW